jgi:hypothetical protein
MSGDSWAARSGNSMIEHSIFGFSISGSRTNEDQKLEVESNYERICILCSKV